MSISLSERISGARRERTPLIMGVVNVTPDSFSDGGLFEDPGRAIEHALSLLEQGAEILDIGGESTRPGADPVTEEQELSRVLPVIQGLRKECAALISIDTSKAAVMREAVRSGADMINDVRALQAAGALEAAAELDVPVCLMHMQGNPQTMQNAPTYSDVIAEQLAFFEQRLEACKAAGVRQENIVLDPGFGFGKLLGHNLTLLNHLEDLTILGFPLLAGLSRKSMLGQLTNRARAHDRVAASVAAALIAAQNGATILRVHDVAETSDAIKVWLAVRASANS
ncbi:MAG: dihydropteroate synthase [Wenzhouxiangella sp.]|jgi:dihydropteroate synthase|nr:dihydropteroate synthase [Wenzhouxiangella sp.]